MRGGGGGRGRIELPVNALTDITWCILTSLDLTHLETSRSELGRLLSVMGRARGLWLVVAIVAIVAIVAGTIWLSTFVWRSPNKNDLAGFWSFVAAVVAIALVLIGGLIRQVQSAESRQTRRNSGESRGSALDDVADLLAGAVKDVWSAAADQRYLRQPEPIPVRWKESSEPVGVPAWAAARSEQFKPLPGLEKVEPGDLREGGLRDLYSIYGGLGSGRIVIVGTPGSGKTGAAMLLVLAALEHRKQVPEEERPQVPVPVLLTLHGWDPNAQDAQAWLAERLQQTYSLLFAGKDGAAQAADLVRTGRIAIILDGLDEIPDQLQPVALAELSRQDVLRVVVLARSAEMAVAAQDGLLENAVALELQDVDPLTAADYLTRVQRHPAPRGWRDLIDRLRHTPESPIAEALNSPLTLTLVRDTYRAGDNILELLDFCDAADNGSSRQDIEDHLLDRVLPVAYAPRPGARYQLEAAQRALSHIATQMNQDRTRDLAWWRIPMWAPALPRLIVTALVSGLVFGLALGLGVGLTSGLGLVGGLVSGFLGGLAGGCGCAVLGFGGHTPTRMAPWRWRQMLSRSTYVAGWAGNWLVGGLAFGLLAGIAVGLLVRLGLGLGITLVSWVVIGLVVVLLGGLSQSASEDNASPLRPLDSWQGDRTFGLVTALVVGLVSGLALGLAIELGVGLESRHGLTLVSWVVVGLVIGLGVGLVATEAWPASLAFAQLAGRWHTPVRLMRFLEDAREHDVLRTVGPVYQFRHARLQDRLANPAGFQKSDIGC